MPTRFSMHDMPLADHPRPDHRAESPFRQRRNDFALIDLRRHRAARVMHAPKGAGADLNLLAAARADAILAFQSAARAGDLRASGRRETGTLRLRRHRAVVGARRVSKVAGALDGNVLPGRRGRKRAADDFGHVLGIGGLAEMLPLVPVGAELVGAERFGVEGTNLLAGRTVVDLAPEADLHGPCLVSLDPGRDLERLA